MVPESGQAALRPSTRLEAIIELFAFVGNQPLIRAALTELHPVAITRGLFEAKRRT